MRFGDYDIEMIRLCRFRMDGGAMFGVVPKKLWMRAYPHCDDENRIEMAAYAFLVRGNGRTIIIDSGLGEKHDEKTSRIFAIERDKPSLAAALESRDIARKDVTDLILTHLHFDHAGGLTELASDGKAVPVFPNARHYVQREQLAWARDPSLKDRASYLPANWEPLAEAGLLEELDGSYVQELPPGVEVHVVNGHTRAMQMVLIRGANEAGAKGCLLAIDLVPTRAHLPVHYVGGIDNHPLLSIEEKQQWLRRVHEENLVICFGHDVATPGATLRAGAKGLEIAAAVHLDYRA